MKKIHLNQVEAEAWSSPQGKFAQTSRQISLALGRDPKGPPEAQHPFDLEHVVVPPGKAACPYHAHSSQWEMFVFIAGRGQVRTPEGLIEVGPGDVALHPPGSPHQTINVGEDDLIYYIVADNPRGEAVYYPDSDKWMVPAKPRSQLLRGAPLDYFDGEE
jgi:mannose-6-phosphate isomerase-like protein (cupin superfamily)